MTRGQVPLPSDKPLHLLELRQRATPPVGNFTAMKHGDRIFSATSCSMPSIGEYRPHRLGSLHRANMHVSTTQKDAKAKMPSGRDHRVVMPS